MPAIPEQTVGALLALLQERRGARADLARYCGVSYGAVLNWLKSGKTRSANLLKIEAFLEEYPQILSGKIRMPEPPGAEEGTEAEEPSGSVAPAAPADGEVLFPEPEERERKDGVPPASEEAPSEASVPASAPAHGTAPSDDDDGTVREGRQAAPAGNAAGDPLAALGLSGLERQAFRRVAADLGMPADVALRVLAKAFIGARGFPFELCVRD